ncbi:MAG: ABC transporter ATP-binding protein/permease [Bacillales bacterium]|nr:ABC transporter ATP-binding protein/permease [Bacillales bacterium]
MIKIENLNKYYNKGKSNENHVINNLSVEFGDKGLVVFFGPSGCGKTTLLNVIGCLDTFNSGSITFEDETYNKYIPKTFDELRNHLIGYIFQNYNLIDSKNVYDNVMLPLDMLGITDTKEKERRVDYALESVGMFKYRRRSVLALSGGQRQRVAIARALAKNPKVIIADEPTGNLDSNNTFDVMNIIKKISKERLVILVSHEKNLVDFYADRILELKDGVVVSDRENNNSEGISHKDVRNIYLKDYKKREVKSGDVSLNIYDDNKNDKPINIDIVFRNGQVFIKNKTESKINYIENDSEVKLLDASEEDFKKKIIEDTSSFNLDVLGEVQKSTDKNGYIPLTKSIKDGFSRHKRFLKRGVFTYIALIIASIIFAFVLSSLSNIFNYDKADYLSVSDQTVVVTLERKDTRAGYTRSNVEEDAAAVPGFKRISIYGGSSIGMSVISINFAQFYQSSYSSTTSFGFYPVDKTIYEYTIEYGADSNTTNQIVISKWEADLMLDSDNAAQNGYTTYADLIDQVVTINVNYSTGDSYTISGISSSDCPVVIFDHDLYDSFAFAVNTSTTIYIETTDKAQMVEALSAKYSNVSDPVKDGKNDYIKSQLSAYQSQIIFMSIVAIAIFIYLTLMIRASMFKKIKDIGILRSVGARKKDIISIFAGEMFSLTTVTSVIGFSLVFLMIFYMNTAFSLEALGLSFGKVTIWNYLLGISVMYLINILAGLIPIFSLMHKTPVEIIKQYDI